MSCPHDGHKQPFLFGNPFRSLLPRNSQIPTKFIALINSFEKKLKERIEKLALSFELEGLSFSWMRSAMASLSDTHKDIKTLITDLQFPISDWDGQWMNEYLDNSVKLLDICIALNSEISRYEQSRLSIQYALHVIKSKDHTFEKQMTKSSASLDDWRRYVGSKNSRLESCSLILDKLLRSLDLPKGRNSAKEKTLFRAMYGVKVLTVFVCSVILAGFMRTPVPLIDLQVPEKFSWAHSYTSLRARTNEVVRMRSSVRDMEAVAASVERVLSAICGAEVESLKEVEGLEELVGELGDEAEKFAKGLDELSKGVGDFFQIILSGRDALLCNLRASDIMHGGLKENKGIM